MELLINPLDVTRTPSWRWPLDVIDGHQVRGGTLHYLKRGGWREPDEWVPVEPTDNTPFFFIEPYRSMVLEEQLKFLVGGLDPDARHSVICMSEATDKPAMVMVWDLDGNAVWTTVFRVEGVPFERQTRADLIACAIVAFDRMNGNTRETT